MKNILVSLGLALIGLGFAACTANSDPAPTGCGAYEVACDYGCMPVGASCCGDGYYCAAGSYCESNGTCLVPNSGLRSKKLSILAADQ
jgi:hypothetical protein